MAYRCPAVSGPRIEAAMSLYDLDVTKPPMTDQAAYRSCLSL